MFLSECTACPAIDLQRTYIKTPTTTQLFDTTSEYEQYNSGCPITQLPVEILFNIFRKAATRRKGKWSRRLGELSKVCRTFRRCVLSRTFTSIHLINYEEDDHSLAPPCTRVKRLYRLIAIDPTIGQYCKHLSIKLPSAKARYRANPLILTPEAYSLAIQLLQFMPNLRTLDVTNGFGQACTLPFFREVLRGRDCLQTLRLIASFGTYDPVELSIDHVWECIRDLQLDELFVACLDPSGYSWEIPKVSNGQSNDMSLTFLYSHILCRSYSKHHPSQSLVCYIMGIPQKTWKHSSDYPTRCTSSPSVSKPKPGRPKCGLLKGFRASFRLKTNH